MDGVSAARYCYHRVVAHKYAVAVLQGLSIDDAHRYYDEAMKNFDQIVGAALEGKSQEANIEAMALGNKAIDSFLEDAGMDRY